MSVPVATKEELQTRQEEEEKLARWVRRLAIADVIVVLPETTAQLASAFLNEAESLASDLSVLLGLLFIVIHIAGGVYYWRWLYRIIENERGLFGSAFVKKPSAVVWAYVMPFVNLVRPYNLLKYIYDWSDPAKLPSPPRREIDAQSYREAPSTRTGARAVWKLPFPLGAWWIIRCSGVVFGRLEGNASDLPISAENLGQAQLLQGISSAFDIAEVVLFLLVFRALAARRAERYHRLIGQHEV